MSTLITQELARAQYAQVSRELEQAAAVRRAIAERGIVADGEGRWTTRGHARLTASTRLSTMLGKLGVTHHGKAVPV
ncbi:MAG: hypothetical protein ACTHOG_00385 [Marmoricola sp.]